MSSVYSVPIIDVAPFLASDPVGAKQIIREVTRALENIGFLVLTGHGFDPELQARTLGVAQDFFDLPEDEKLRSWHVPGTFMGYNPLAAERVAYSHGIETAPDLNANFSLGQPAIDERDRQTDVSTQRLACTAGGVSTHIDGILPRSGRPGEDLDGAVRLGASIA